VAADCGDPELTLIAAGVAAVTATGLLAVMVALLVSVTVIAWVPAVLSVAVKEPLPFASVPSGGSVACESVLVKWTVPE
jgi:hypothetical protein